MVVFKNEKITPKQCFKSRGFYNKMIKLSRLLGKDKENATQKQNGIAPIGFHHGEK